MVSMGTILDYLMVGTITDRTYILTLTEHTRKRSESKPPRGAAVCCGGGEFTSAAGR
jgi:hypothetical protein